MKALRYLIAIIASFIVVFLLWVNYQAERMTIDPAPTVARVQGPTPTIPPLTSSNARTLLVRAINTTDGINFADVRDFEYDYARKTLFIPY